MCRRRLLLLRSMEILPMMNVGLSYSSSPSWKLRKDFNSSGMYPSGILSTLCILNTVNLANFFKLLGRAVYFVEDWWPKVTNQKFLCGRYKEGIVEGISFHEVFSCLSTIKPSNLPNIRPSYLSTLWACNLSTLLPSNLWPRKCQTLVKISAKIGPEGKNFFMVEGLRKNCGRYKNSQTK